MKKNNYHHEELFLTFVMILLFITVCRHRKNFLFTD